MIISDMPNHKIDAKFNQDNFLQITAFHLKGGANGTEWTTKMIALNSDAQALIVQMINQHHRDLLDATESGNK